LRYSKVVLLIIAVGLIAGTLDISYNLIFNAFRGITPAMVFRFIASGLIGTNAAVRGGAWSIALGVALHYLIALIWTAVFYVASRTLPVLRQRPIISGLVYGGLVYIAMNWIVLPLSRVPARHNMTVAARINAIVPLLLCIGLTISLLIRKYSAPLSTEAP